MKSLGAVILLVLISGCAVRPSYGTYPDNCPVHGTPLREETARIVYGTPIEVVDADFARQKQKSFPYSDTYAWGGCVDTTAVLRQPSRGIIHYCPQCRVEYAKAIKEWLRKEEQASGQTRAD